MSGKPTILDPLDMRLTFIYHFQPFFFQYFFFSYKRILLPIALLGKKSKRPLLKSFDKTKKGHFAK